LSRYFGIKIKDFIECFTFLDTILNIIYSIFMKNMMSAEDECIK